MSLIHKILILLTIICASVAQSAEYRLGGEFIDNPREYEDDVNRIRKGDTISFGDKKFSIIEELGRGGVTRVFAISGSRAIRVPRVIHWRNYICETIEGFKIMQHSQLQVAKVFLDQSSKDCEFAIVERLPIQFTMAEWLSYRADKNFFIKMNDNAGRIAEAEKKHDLVDALKVFIASTYQFSSLSSDFYFRQIGWAGDHWVLFDWFANVKKAKRVYDYHPFQGASFNEYKLVIGDFDAEITKLIYAIRQEKLGCGSLLRGG
jgi:hypothetical protein